jgi:hypothetical protein
MGLLLSGDLVPHLEVRSAVILTVKTRTTDRFIVLLWKRIMKGRRQNTHELPL